MPHHPGQHLTEQGISSTIFFCILVNRRTPYTQQIPERSEVNHNVCLCQPLHLPISPRRKSTALLSKNRTSVDKSTAVPAKFSNAGFSNNGSIFNLTQVPARPRLTSIAPNSMLRERMEVSCSCPKCSAARRNEAPTQVEQSPVASESPTPTQSEATEAEASTAGFVVDDSVSELSDGQLKKTEFLRQLREQICAAVGPALATVGQTTEGCPTSITGWICIRQKKRQKLNEQ